MTRLLIMMGIPATVTAATDSNPIVASSASGTLAHAQAGTVDLKEHEGLYSIPEG